MIDRKYILEAINRGIQLALDDYEEDFGNSISPIKDNIKSGIPMKELIWINENFVDLGLPSGTLWYKYNLGCDCDKLNFDKNLKNEDYIGEEYAWTIEPFEKIKDHLLNEKKLFYNIKMDPAYQINKNFKMPTSEQFKELKNYTNFDYLYDKKSFKFINKNDDSKYILIPGDCKYYWSSSTNKSFWVDCLYLTEPWSTMLFPDEKSFNDKVKKNIKIESKMVGEFFYIRPVLNIN